MEWEEKKEAELDPDLPRVALHIPTAFHCIPLFLFSTWGLPLWSRAAEAVLHSDQVIWSLPGGFTEVWPS